MERQMGSRSSSTKISVVIPVLNEAEHVRRTIERLFATLPADSEIIVVDDGSVDDSVDYVKSIDDAPVRLLHTYDLGVAGARNYGARHAAGEVIVFADAHVETPPGWCKPLLAALEDPHTALVAPAITALGDTQNVGFGLRLVGPDLGIAWLGCQHPDPYPVPLVSGCFLAMRRRTFADIGGFDAGMRRWGSEDIELSLRLWLLGYEVRIVPQVEVAHLFREHHPYAVEWSLVLHNMLRLAFVHFTGARIARVVEAFKQKAEFAAALALTLDDRTCDVRAALLSRRVHDDDWFFDRFEMVC
jgi:GT2 family glycosyltransferase